MYLSLAGAALLAAWGFARAPRAARRAALLVAAALGVQAFVRAGVWKDDDALYAAALADHDSPGARYYFAYGRFVAGTDELRRAQTLSAGAPRDDAERRGRALLEDALAEEHRAIAVWRGYDPSAGTRSRVLRRFEVVAAQMCSLLGRFDEALFHAEEALRIDPTFDAFAEHERATALLALGYAPEAAAAMRRARGLGLADRGASSAFFVHAGAKCEADGLFAAAEDAYAEALDAAPDDAARRAAQDRLFAVRRRARPADAAAAEAEKIRRLDEELARRPRSCPEESRLKPH